MSRVLFPESSSSNRQSTSRSMKRNDSMISLPSPPMDSSYPASISPASFSTTMEQDNPFLSGGNLNNSSTTRPDHPSSSPTQHVRKHRRIDKDRIQVDKIISKSEIIGMGRGWDSPSNPFLEREGDAELRNSNLRGRGVKPDKMTYVFRGKRITYDFPLDSLLAQDPEDSPFPIPSPRLLFPAPPTTPPATSCSSSSFLNALRTAKRGMKEVVDHGLPTPVQERVGKKFKRNVDVMMRE